MVVAMAYDDAAFRAQFPEFTDPVLYPAAVFSSLWTIATNFISAPGCPLNFLTGNSYPIALNYMTAALWVLSNQQNQPGQTPGSNQGGFETSATIDKISVTTLAPPATNMWTWWLAQTPYGQALAALLQLKAVGGTSVGGLPERLAFRKVGGIFL
jgi:hypothetical protein